MKNWTPGDWIALGLLGFIYVYLIAMILWSVYSDREITDDAGIRGKEVVIYIIGVLSGYLGIKRIDK